MTGHSAELRVIKTVISPRVRHHSQAADAPESIGHSRCRVKFLEAQVVSALRSQKL